MVQLFDPLRDVPQDSIAVNCWTAAARSFPEVNKSPNPDVSLISFPAGSGHSPLAKRFGKSSHVSSYES